MGLSAWVNKARRRNVKCTCEAMGGKEGGAFYGAQAMTDLISLGQSCACAMSHQWDRRRPRRTFAAGFRRLATEQAHDCMRPLLLPRP